MKGEWDGRRSGPFEISSKFSEAIGRAHESVDACLVRIAPVVLHSVMAVELARKCAHAILSSMPVGGLEGLGGERGRGRCGLQARRHA